MNTIYGIEIPRGVQKDWEANSMGVEGAGEYLRKRFVPDGWGDPANCVAWFDRFGRLRLCVAYYANGRSALVRSDMNGRWKVTFGQVPASVDTHPKDGDALAAPLVSGAARSEAKGDAHEQ